VSLPDDTETETEIQTNADIETRADIVLCPDGPMLVRGQAVIEDADGTQHATTRPVSAVCRCGRTSRAPWCDGTHKLIADGARSST
jgi:CDGSH-type Zn-finger protein